MVECCLGGVETSPLVGGICNTPTYCDLGKAAKDDFNKGYGFGSVKVGLRTKSCRGVEFSTSGHAYTDTEQTSGNLETKYKVLRTCLHPEMEHRRYSWNGNRFTE
uniref:Uncharacterized protein n=1 Tax=Panthera leo TaxID=9689 RepID=A0A8C8Y992_PANLE